MITSRPKKLAIPQTPRLILLPKKTIVFAVRTIERHHILLPLPINMETSTTERDASKARKDRTKSNEQIGPDRSDR